MMSKKDLNANTSAFAENPNTIDRNQELSLDQHECIKKDGSSEEINMVRFTTLKDMFELFRDVGIDSIPAQFREGWIEVILADTHRFLSLLKIAVRLEITKTYSMELSILNNTAYAFSIPAECIESIPEKWPKENGRYLTLDEVESRPSDSQWISPFQA